MRYIHLSKKYKKKVISELDLFQDVISKDNKILHSELVSEIADEPNYQAALDSIK